MTAKTHEANFWQLVERMEVQERHRGERSTALPRNRYQDPARQIRLGQAKKGGEVDRLSDREIADSLLCEWFRWSKAWRPALGSPRISPYAKGYTGDERHNEAAEDDKYAAAHKREMEAIQYCVDTLPLPLRQSVGTEMRNREVKAKVWRDSSNREFSEALQALLPAMRKHANLSNYFCG